MIVQLLLVGVFFVFLTLSSMCTKELSCEDGDILSCVC